MPEENQVVMKEFIYLDTSFLHSFIAQTNSGLPTSIDVESQESKTQTSTKGDTKQKNGEHGAGGSTGKLDIGILQVPSANASLKLSRQRVKSSTVSLSQLEAGKEIISKQLHDNALHEFEHFISENGLLYIQEPYDTLELGQYVKMTSTFKFHDLDLFKKVATKQFAKLFLTDEMEKSKEIEISKVKIDNPTTYN